MQSLGSKGFRVSGMFPNMENHRTSSATRQTHGASCSANVQEAHTSSGESHSDVSENQAWPCSQHKNPKP